MSLTSLLRLTAATAIAATALALTSCDSTQPTRPDTDPPRFGTGYPRAGTPSGENVPLIIVVDEDAAIFFVALASGANAPSAVDVIAGEDRSGNPVPPTHKGEFSATGMSEMSFDMAINDGHSYDVFVVARDNAGNIAAPVRVSVTPPADFPPVFTAGYPALRGEPTSTAEIAVALSKAGTVYAIGLASGAQAPSAAQIKAGTDAAGTSVAAVGSVEVTAANSEVLLTLLGLAPQSDYDVFLAAEDNNGNIGRADDVISFTTAQGASARIAAKGDDTLTAWINGHLVEFEDYATTMTMQQGVNVIAVELVNQIDQWGGAMIAAVSWNGGEDSITSDASWKYSFVAPQGWDGPGFDDSRWHPAHEYTQGPGEAAQSPGTVGHATLGALDSTSKWIFSGPDYYFRSTFTRNGADSATLNVGSVHNNRVYLNGELVTENDQELNAKSVRVALRDGENVLAGFVRDTSKGSFGGNLIAEILFADGDTLVTDSSWKVFVEEVEGWTEVGFDDSDWYQAMEMGDYVLSVNNAPRITGGWGDPWLKNDVFGRKPHPSGERGQFVQSAAFWISAPYTIYFRREFTIE